MIPLTRRLLTLVAPLAGIVAGIGCAAPYIDCEPGDTQRCSFGGYGEEMDSMQWCVEADQGWIWGDCCDPIDPCDCRDPQSEEDCVTPLVLSFDSAPVTYTSEPLATFDLTARGMCVATDWPSAATPWLARDLDHDGTIDDGSELFGSATRLASGALAANGFDAAREIDHDGDGLLTNADAAWADILVWTDVDGDRRSQAPELRSLDEAGITWLELRYSYSLRCDARGNCESERAHFGFRDGEGRPRVGAVVDIHLPTQSR